MSEVDIQNIKNQNNNNDTPTSEENSEKPSTSEYTPNSASCCASCLGSPHQQDILDVTDQINGCTAEGIALLLI